MKNFKKALCILLSVLLVGLTSACSAKSKMSEAQPTPAGLSVPEQSERRKLQGDIFVSPDGDDKNSGTEKSPVKTVQRALQLAESMDKEEKVIYFSKGEYTVSSLKLSEKDNGTVFYAEDEVIFNGGVTLDASDFTEYQDNIKMLDLSKYGVTKEQIGQVKAFGQYNTAEKYGESGSLYCELFCDGERMTL
ncbi:MAG: DUF1565 domain-containing protein, partial [Acutalibacteraceae bacterium]